MTNRKYTWAPLVDDDMFIATWSPTDEELRRIKEFQEYERQGTAFENFLRFGSGTEPSVVFDEVLFLGTLNHGSNLDLLERLKIVHIINVSETDASDKFPSNHFDIVYIPMEDDVRTNIKQHFNRTNELLHSYYMKNERCLVHCAAGVSRSATIVLAYLMKYHHNTVTEAFRYLVEKRPQIWPNQGFMLQLIHYENELIKSREILSTSETSEAFNSTAVPSANDAKNPIETLHEFKK
ncbi:unnamed protein product [Rotaria socialis]|uniref:protein-tyrosine-phosphatase n=1 Tax=Rotaria socialis TaxID=392032 RepID=A0A820TQ23_9BILA|nr:unnamed protein product [Rotaria socialis]CAF4452856.1 unnamed protein product [Rotaria socialis]CAF4475087.1 unnamed protein product [Rotaria socialis]